jgi:hypothetical protein
MALPAEWKLPTSFVQNLSKVDTCDYWINGEVVQGERKPTLGCTSPCVDGVHCYRHSLTNRDIMGRMTSSNVDRRDLPARSRAWGDARYHCDADSQCL